MIMSSLSLQNYAVRLANARGRRKEPEGGDTKFAPAQTSSPAAAVPAPAGGGSGKIRLLRRQLEDAQMKEREERDRALDLEELVRALQSDLASREDVIQRMREEQFSVASFQEGAAGGADSPPGSPFVMSPHNM